MTGFYPEVFLTKGIDTRIWHENYIKTYMEKDIRDIYNISSIGDFRDFMKISASRVGQLFNIASVSSAARTPATTVKRWLSILEASGIIFILKPYHTNFGKRFTKMPKLYFYDTGILCSLLGIRDKRQLYESAFFGHIFENFCMAEALKILGCRGRENDAWFLRTKKGLEADFIFAGSETRITAEFKAGMSAGSKPLEQLKRVEEELKLSGAAETLLVNMSNDAVPKKRGYATAGCNSFFKLLGEIKE